MVLAMDTEASPLSGTDAKLVTTFTSVCTPSAFSSLVEAITVEAGDPETNTGLTATSGPAETGLDGIP